MTSKIEIIKNIGKAIVVICCIAIAILCVISAYNQNKRDNNQPDDTLVTESVLEDDENNSASDEQNKENESLKLNFDEKYETVNDVPDYPKNSPYLPINENKPFFTDKEITAESYVEYRRLDKLGRCATATACIGPENLGVETEDLILDFEPTGWHETEYEILDYKCLYSKCNLINCNLGGEFKNSNNVFTGTNFLKNSIMSTFEKMIYNCISSTGNHVLYRVTPVFKGENLVASGVQLEAFSVEDNGERICFNVYLYNYDPAVEIDYATGESYLAK